MGLTDAVFGMSLPDVLKELFCDAGITSDPASLLDGTPISIAAKTGQRFCNISGRLYYYSQALADQGRPPLPDWQPEPVGASNYPLRLLTTPGYFQIHTAFSSVASLRKRKGVPCAVLHPTDATSRGLSDGQVVHLRNDRGRVSLRLQVLDEV